MSAPKKPMDIVYKLGLWYLGIVVVMVGMIVWFRINPPDAWRYAVNESNRAQREPDIHDMYRLQSQSHGYVLDYLVAPSTAKFGTLNGAGTGVSYGSNALVAVVKGRVDSQNRFGAMIRSKWMIIYTNYSGTMWPIYGHVDGEKMFWKPAVPPGEEEEEADETDAK